MTLGQTFMALLLVVFVMPVVCTHRTAPDIPVFFFPIFLFHSFQFFLSILYLSLFVTYEWHIIVYLELPPSESRQSDSTCHFPICGTILMA